MSQMTIGRKFIAAFTQSSERSLYRARDAVHLGKHLFVETYGENQDGFLDRLATDPDAPLKKADGTPEGLILRHFVEKYDVEDLKWFTAGTSPAARAAAIQATFDPNIRLDHRERVLETAIKGIIPSWGGSSFSPTAIEVLFEGFTSAQALRCALCEARKEYPYSNLGILASYYMPARLPSASDAEPRGKFYYDWAKDHRAAKEALEYMLAPITNQHHRRKMLSLFKPPQSCSAADIEDLFKTADARVEADKATHRHFGKRQTTGSPGFMPA